MKRPVTVFIVIFVLLALSAIGCTNKELVGPAPGEGEETVSTCVTCHTDKDTLKELATEEEVVKSEATTGEG
jgi:hypothetical protein